MYESSDRHIGPLCVSSETLAHARLVAQISRNFALRNSTLRTFLHPHSLTSNNIPLSKTWPTKFMMVPLASISVRRLQTLPEREIVTYTAQVLPTRVWPTMRAQASKSVSLDGNQGGREFVSDPPYYSRQRARKFHHTILRILHIRRAPDRRGCKEPGRHEPCEHRLRYQVSWNTG